VAGGATADHFDAAGQNDRIWNALEKLALRAPGVFADYYANNLIAAVCRAWLGPGYQVTSQINVVNPAGAAQTAHRDYHLGFASAEQAARLPLTKGDAVFFNPAVFHAAGANRAAAVTRMPNLLQVSSAFGRPMETVDRSAMSVAVLPALLAKADDGASPALIANVIATCAEGYAFPPTWT
jgi:ectoine hydroxylase-related dioxygenase (phytanoyl-CoA dioxygenase family)